MSKFDDILTDIAAGELVPLGSIPYLVAALRKCRSQRDSWASWYVKTRDGKLLMSEEQLKDDAELLAILEGKEGK